MRKPLKYMCLFLLTLALFVSFRSIPVHANPGAFESHPTAHTIDSISVTNPGNAWDSNDATNAYFRYCPTDGDFRVDTFNTGGHSEAITKVDFKMKYSTTISSKDDVYRIVYYVSPSATAVVLKGWTRDTTALATFTWLNQAEPNDATWDWTDISNIEFVVEINRVGGADSGGDFYEYEAWVTVTYTDPAPDGISVQPSSIIDYGLTAGKSFYVEVMVTNFVDLYGADFSLSYDTSVLTATNVDETGNIFIDGGWTPDYAMWTKNINDTAGAGGAGKGRIRLSLSEGLGEAYGVDGSGRLANITFTVDALGQSNLHIYYEAGGGLVDSSANDITHDVTDGYFENQVAVPEFPLGAALEIALLGVIVYLWRKRKGKVKISRTHAPALR